MNLTFSGCHCSPYQGYWIPSAMLTYVRMPCLSALIAKTLIAKRHVLHVSGKLLLACCYSLRLYTHPFAVYASGSDRNSSILPSSAFTLVVYFHRQSSWTFCNPFFNSSREMQAAEYPNTTKTEPTPTPVLLFIVAGL